MKELAASALAQKIGYLRVEDFPSTSIFETLPARSLGPHRIIRCKDELCLVKEGSVEIWHTPHDYMVKELTPGTLFGEIPLLGQTLIGTQAISGTSGATVAVADATQARKWAASGLVTILEKLGPRLAMIDAEHYRARFQLADSRIAAVLLELAGTGSMITGLRHEDIGERIGLYRETVTIILTAMKSDKLIDLGRKRITILDKRALQELSEL